jgi:hypothetical protein
MPDGTMHRCSYGALFVVQRAHWLAQEGLKAVTQAIDDIATDSGATDSTTNDATMEGVLLATERTVESALKSATSTVSSLKKSLAGARTGQIRELRKALAAATEAANSLAEQTRRLTEGFTFDEQAYLASGAYTKELLAVAEARGVSMFEEDQQLLCYPSLVRVNSSDVAVEIDKKKERRLRPSVLVNQLAYNQERAPRFKVEQFIDSLRSAYELRVAAEGKKIDGVVRLVDIWTVLTMFPGQSGKYSKQEFARDLYLLDQSGVTRTSRSPRELRLSASTGTKGAGVLVTVSRTGQQQRYWGVSFTPDESAGAAAE